MIGYWSRGRGESGGGASCGGGYRGDYATSGEEEDGCTPTSSIEDSPSGRGSFSIATTTGSGPESYGGCSDTDSTDYCTAVAGTDFDLSAADFSVDY